jgi:hypothetical protein
MGGISSVQAACAHAVHGVQVLHDACPMPGWAPAAVSRLRHGICAYGLGMTNAEPPDADAIEARTLEPYGPQGQAIYDGLVAAARAREFVFYSALGDELGLDLQDERERLRLWDVLCEISRSEVSVGRPMLSAICVQEQDHLPGHTFFTLGTELGMVRPGEDEVDFAVRQIRAVHDHWSEMAPYGERHETDLV